MNEFQLIERFFAPLGRTDDPFVVKGQGDDCAAITVASGRSMCFSVDTLVEGVHFPKNAPPKRLAYRALACALSDLAAMGATPAFFTLALTLPEPNQKWLSEFSSGLKILVDKYRFPLLGGDTTRGPLTISIQVHGWLDQAPLLRSGARPGDLVLVSGTLGDAGAALGLLDSEGGESKISSIQAQFLLDRYYSPAPQIELGQALLGYASSCIDISDGLLAEAEHIARASSVSLSIEAAQIPLSESLLLLFGHEQAMASSLSSGDDYELLFTISPDSWIKFSAVYNGKLPTRIGKVQDGTGVYLDNEPLNHHIKGYQHFE